MSGVVLASDLDANFNALAAAINEGNPATAGTGIIINSGGTISFNPAGTSLNGATIGGNNLQTAFLSLYNTGTQTVPGTVNYSGELFAQSGIFITPTGSVNWVGGGNTNQNNPQPNALNSSIHLNGSVVGGAFANYHEMLLIDSVNVGTAYSMNGFTFSHDANNGSGSMTGGRQAFTTGLNVTCPTGNLGGAVYTALTSLAIVTGNDNGSPSSHQGSVFGFNPVTNLMPQGTTPAYWASCVGTELDFAVASGVTVDLNFGFHICTQAAHAVNGELDDIALHISGSVGQTAFWKYGLGFGANVKPTAFGPASTLIKVFPDVVSNTLTIANAIDLTPATVTITGNVLISQGATITGSGNATFTSIGSAKGTIAAAGTSQATATPITAQDCVVSSGTGGVRLVNFNGAECIVRNRVGTTITLYPQSGAQIETAGTNVGLTLPNGTDGRFSPFSNTQWYY